MTNYKLIPNCYELLDTCPIVSNACVYGFVEAVRRAKYPMAVDMDVLDGTLTDGIVKIAKAEKGSGHDNWLNGVVVQFDLTFSNKAWVEMERYHFIDFISSQSTMHRITRFDLDKPGAYIKYTDPRMIEIMQELVADYNESKEAAEYYRAHVNLEAPYSEDVQKDFDRAAKENYLKVLYSNPCGFRLTAGMTTNYRQLKTIYAQRRNHRLPEWREFCKWIETLPYSELITGAD